METQIEVVDWINYDDSITENLRASIGEKDETRFQDWMAWGDYLASIQEDLRPYAEAIFRSVKLKRLQIYGWDHVYGINGVPVFSDGTVARYTMRSWANLIAAIWSQISKKTCHYLDFTY